MPKKLLDQALLPSLAQERLSAWGRCIHAQRLRQRITAADLCERVGISATTLHRLERGDPGAGAGAYLAALLTLGVIDEAAPSLPPPLWSGLPGRRVKLSRQEKGEGADDDDF